MPQAKTDGLSAEQRAQLHQVADLMLAIYQTLVDMCYVHPDGIIEGPHDITQMSSVWQQHKLDPAIVYLYSIMPYFDTTLADAESFLHGGSFFNHMDPDDVQDGQDPFYASPQGDFDDEEGQYMYPWYTPLSKCRERSPVVIYDARGHRIWIVDQIQNISTDLVLCPDWYRDAGSEQGKGSDWGDSGESSWSTEDESMHEEAGEKEAGEDADSQGSSEVSDDRDGVEQNEVDALHGDQSEDVDFDEGFEVVDELSDSDRREALQLKNQNSLDLFRSRDADAVLQDINRWYRELKALPGQGEDDWGLWVKSEKLRQLYLRNGWPGDFNRDAFTIDLVRTRCAEKAKYDAKEPKYEAKEPLRNVECHEEWSPLPDRDSVADARRLKKASREDRAWIPRLERCRAAQRRERREKELRFAREKAERLCPGGVCIKDADLPLWKCEMLRVESQSRRESTRRSDDWADCYRAEGDTASIRALEIAHRHNVRKTALYERALAASRADAERLCPSGRTFQQATGLKSLEGSGALCDVEQIRHLIEHAKGDLDQLKQFALEMPGSAVQSKEMVEQEIEECEGDIEGLRERLRRSEASSA